MLKRLPWIGPLVGELRESLRAGRERPTQMRALRATRHPHGARIAEVLCHVDAQSTVWGDERLAAIEKERAALLAREEPLVCGQLGEAGLHDEGVSVAAACRVSKPEVAARMMYGLVRAIAPRRMIELGTNLGVSSAYQAAALAWNGSGRLVTLEASPYRQHLARELHGRLELDRVDYRLGLFADVLDDVIAEFAPFDFAFIDGHHQREPTLDYFDRIWRHAAPDAVFVFDDIRWSDGMREAWAMIQGDARVRLAVDLGSVGVCVTSREADDLPREVLPPFWSALERPPRF